jgi:Zn-dependent membrane protease YugP
MFALPIFLFTLAISLYATYRVKSMIAKYSQVPASSGLTGAETAAHILRASGINDVSIVQGTGILGDHFDPKNSRLVLSPDVFNGSSTAAVGIAAHECGHAIQRQVGYAPLQLRMGAVSATMFASQIVSFLPFIFFFTHDMAVLRPLLMVGALAWGVVMVFNLVTLPVEFDASNRAKALLPEMGIIRGEGEMTAVNKVLNAAALTYVAAFLSSLGYLLYYLMLLSGGRNR